MSFQVSLQNQQGIIHHDPAKLTTEQLTQAIDDMGFEVKGKQHQYQDVVVYIEGMTCMSCVRSIEGNMVAVNGVKFIKVSLEKKLGYVKYDPESLTPEAIRQSIEDMGFDVSLTPPAEKAQKSMARLSVEGMTCQSCVKNIESVIGEKPGVIEIQVNLEKKEAVIWYDSKQTSPTELQDLIEDMGFTASLIADKQSEHLSSGNTLTCVIRVEGMTCQSCVKNIEGNMKKYVGVNDITVSLERKEANIKYDPSACDPETLRGQIENLGFDAFIAADPDSCSISIRGMTCQSCVRNIESNISAVPGVCKVTVSLEDNKADIQYRCNIITASEITEKINDIGYDAKLLSNEKGPESNQHHITIVVSGMHSKASTRLIENKLLTLPGVNKVESSLLSGTADVWYNEDKVTTEQLCAAVNAAGSFSAKVQGESLCFVMKSLCHVLCVFVSMYMLYICYSQVSKHIVICLL